MKVLEVNVDDNGYGGVYSLICTLIENKPSDLHIDIACLEPFEKKENAANLRKYGCEVHYIGRKGNKVAKQFAYYLKLKQLCKNKNYDCVHIHSDVSNKMLILGLATKKIGARHIILHSHATGVDGEHRKLKKAVHYAGRIFLPLVGTDFVACSDLAAQWMFPNVDKNNLRLIHNGIELEKFRYNEDDRKIARKELGLTDELLIGHIGRFAYQKNHEYILKIFREALKLNPKAKLLLIGKGPMEKRIKELSEEMELMPKIIFYGTSNNIEHLLQAMDVFVLPSHFEGLPIVGVEAQAAGTPTIFSDKITKSAGLTKICDFLPITNESLSQWARKVCMYGEKGHEDTYEQLKMQGFDIQTTIDEFVRLYQ